MPERTQSPANQPADLLSEASEPKFMGLYTAVVIVHGMGNSRRYDNLSHLADTLELYAQADQPTRGVWRAPEPRRWHVNLKDRDHLYYLKAKHSPDESGVGTRHVRFFEAYWAPKMAGGLPALDVLKTCCAVVGRI